MLEVLIHFWRLGPRVEKIRLVENSCKWEKGDSYDSKKYTKLKSQCKKLENNISRIKFLDCVALCLMESIFKELKIDSV